MNVRVNTVTIACTTVLYVFQSYIKSVQIVLDNVLGKQLGFLRVLY